MSKNEQKTEENRAGMSAPVDVLAVMDAGAEARMALVIRGDCRWRARIEGGAE